MNLLALIRRDAVAITNVLSALIVLVSLTAHLDAGQQGALNTVAVAVMALLGTVGVVTADKLVPFVVGVGKAVVALVVAFGLHLDPTMQVAIITVLETLSALLLRGQLTSVVPPRSAS